VEDQPLESAVPEHALLRITDELAIPLAELEFRATRAGGPGGQHVNTSSTRIELLWNAVESPSLTDAQRARITERLANRIDGGGVLRLSASSSRSQHQNREEATARLQRLVGEALKERKARKRTRPPRAAKEARLKSKKKRAETKRSRAPVRGEE
jgi:ribosome-associated protein